MLWLIQLLRMMVRRPMIKLTLQKGSHNELPPKVFFQRRRNYQYFQHAGRDVHFDYFLSGYYYF